MKFKEFILFEQKQYLAQKVGDILAAAQELRDDAGNMGSRDLSRFSERIVNQIRRVLHSYWAKENQRYLKDLQKIGVAVIKAVKEKGDLANTISGATSSLEKLVSDLGTPINKIAAPESSDEKVDSQDSLGTANSIKDQYKAPPQKKNIEIEPNQGAPINKDVQLTDNPSLGGNSGQSLGAI